MEELGGGRVLIVTDPGIVKVGIVERAVRSLRQASLEVCVFEGTEENPTTRHVEAGVHFAKAQGEVDLIVGLGGGSAMDCAKGVNLILTNGGKMEDYWGMGKAVQPMLPSIGIPTTAGTGSEAQSYALIAREASHQKMACGDVKARFWAVILDPVLTESVPKSVAAAAGMDAVSHALESYVSTRRNPVSQMFALRAWELLEGSFEISLSEPASVEARGKMLLGAHLAGAAIENSMLGAAHACANPLTARYGMTHGIAVGLMLPVVIRFNGQVEAGLYEGLAAHRAQADRQRCVALLVDRIVRLKATAGLPECLRDFRIERGDLPLLAKEAAGQWTGTFNPRRVTEGDFLQLYEAVY